MTEQDDRFYEIVNNLEEVSSELSQIRAGIEHASYKETVYHSEVGIVCGLKVILSQALITAGGDTNCRVTLFDVPEREDRYFDCHYLLVSRYNYKEANFCITLPFTTPYPPIEEYTKAWQDAMRHLDVLEAENKKR